MTRSNDSSVSKSSPGVLVQIAVRAFGCGRLRIVAVLTIAVIANLLGRRFDRRWDFTSDHRYTPSASLRSIIETLKDDVAMTVLLGRSDPLAPTLEQLLAGYRLMSPHVSLDWVDPDREPVRFLSRQAELGLSPGRTEDGQVASDAIVVIAARGRRHYIEAADVVGLDPEGGESTSRFEYALTVALRSLFERISPTVCFTEGHRELSTSDQSPLGLSKVKSRLEHEAIVTKSVDLSSDGEKSLRDCRLIIVAAPDVTLSPHALQLLTSATTRSSLLLLGGVVPDTGGRLVSVGIEALAKLGGISMGMDVVVELEDAFRLPNVFGETFLATPKEHPVTRGLLRGTASAPLHVVVSLAQSLSKTVDSQALPLLVSSQASIALRNVSEEEISRLGTTHHEAKRRVVAMVGPLHPADHGEQRLGVAPANILQNRTFDAPNLRVTQAFTLSLISWLATTQSSKVEFEPRPERLQGLELSDEELTSISRYTTLVMPGSFFLVGLSVLLLRRKRSRREPQRRQETQD